MTHMYYKGLFLFPATTWEVLFMQYCITVLVNFYSVYVCLCVCVFVCVLTYIHIMFKYQTTGIVRPPTHAVSLFVRGSAVLTVHYC